MGTPFSTNFFCNLFLLQYKKNIPKNISPPPPEPHTYTKLYKKHNFDVKCMLFLYCCLQLNISRPQLILAEIHTHDDFFTSF